MNIETSRDAVAELLSRAPFMRLFGSILLVASVGGGMAGCNYEVQDVVDRTVDAQEQPGDEDTTTEDAGWQPPNPLDSGGGNNTSNPDPRDPDAGSGGPEVDTSWDWGRSDGADAPEMAIERVVPSSGPIEGGNRVRIVGTGLTEETDIFFGSRQVETRLSAGTLVGTAPEGTGAGPVSVKAVTTDGESDALDEGYHYVRGVEVDEINPVRLPTDGGVQVEIRGSGFSEPTSVSFDGAAALRVERVDATLLRAVAPPGDVGPADVRVTNARETELLENAVTYWAPLEIDAVKPAAGSVDGGERVTIEGAGFGRNVEVYFGGKEATVESVDARGGTVEVTTPAHTSGAVDVSIQSSEDAQLLKDGYLYRSSEQAGTPTLEKVRPGWGPAAGGTQVLLTGDGFDASNLAVTFGGDPATVVDSGPTWILVETPAGQAGRVDVAVSVDGTEIDRLQDGFEYRADVWVDSVSPASGPVEGGTTVTLEGAGFEGADRVLFGGLPAEFTVVSDSTIEAVTPRHSTGEVDVVVERRDVEGRYTDGFTYQAPLEIWGFSPVRGAVAGGTYVELRGRGFAGDIGVRVGGNEATDVRRIDANNLYFHTPPGEQGEVDVEVTVDGESLTAPYRFEYFNPASRYGGTTGGEVRGAVNVTVMSEGGGPIPGAYVTLSTRVDSTYSGLTDQSGQVTLSGPDVRGPQTVTATAAGYSAATIRSADAENVTVFLSMMDPPPPDDGDNGGGGGGGQLPFGTISGNVRIPKTNTDPDDPKRYAMATVQTTKETMSGRNIEPGANSVVIGNGEYEIRSRIGDVAVVAFCGVYDEEDEQFVPNYVGVKRFVHVSDGGSYDVDLVCDHPLDQTLPVKLVNPVYAPGGPNVNRADVYWDFGFEGVLEAPREATGMESLLTVPKMPKLEEELADVTFTAVAGSYTGEAGSPLTETTIEDIDSASKTVVTPPLLDVPEPVSPRPGATLEGNTIQFQIDGPHYADLYSVYLYNNRGRTFWHYVLPGDRQSVRLPDFPDFSYLPVEQRPEPMPSGRAFMVVYGVRTNDGASVDDFSYQDLSYDKWEAYTVTSWDFQMP